MVVAMRISARNALKGTVANVVIGPVNAEVTVQLAGGDTVVSIITKESAESLQLEKGKAVYAIVKASNVMIGVE